MIGLLFVAMSVAEGRKLDGPVAEAHRVRASAALTAFNNALTVSLFELIPRLSAGWPVFSVGVVGLAFVARAIYDRYRLEPERRTALRDVTFLAGLLIVFAFQARAGIELIHDSRDDDALQSVAVLVVVCELIGIARAWEMIGGPRLGTHRR